MELKEAKEILKEYKDLDRIGANVTIADAINTVLQELDNSISKSYIENKIEDIDYQLEDDGFKHDLYMGTQKYEQYSFLIAGRRWLQSLLVKK